MVKHANNRNRINKKNPIKKSHTHISINNQSIELKAAENTAHLSVTASITTLRTHSSPSPLTIIRTILIFILYAAYTSSRYHFLFFSFNFAAWDELDGKRRRVLDFLTFACKLNNYRTRSSFCCCVKCLICVHLSVRCVFDV